MAVVVRKRDETFIWIFRFFICDIFLIFMPYHPIRSCFSLFGSRSRLVTLASVLYSTLQFNSKVEQYCWRTLLFYYFPRSYKCARRHHTRAYNIYYTQTHTDKHIRTNTYAHAHKHALTHTQTHIHRRTSKYETS